ncbi:PIR protein CIR protein [Plasmodium vinckei vinckei]|uniref:PIR protein CIR protein n=1 Tax=Plasmodium vinckei vinckei TaxID=54757 RepID=A0A449BS64_PLAVN|nr:PIR protein CIR protein [Plasmodium vinckei vinckei]VEV56189.1 PIR protein CIR protein [Plasmodium vinckei vinckei]
MEKSSYDIEKVYKEIGTIDSYFGVKKENGKTSLYYNELIHKYCNYSITSGTGGCDVYFQWANCGFIYLLKLLKDKYNLDYDKLAQYAILWLSYKLNTAPDGCNINLVKFYTEYIEKNYYYNEKIKDNGSTTYKGIIDKKKDFMNIKEIPKFNALFFILFSSYHFIYDNNFDCTVYLNFVNQFVQYFQELNNDSKNIEKSSFSQILSTLSNDYKNLKNICDNDKSCKIPPIPQLNPKKINALSPESTSSSSSILNIVIPGLSTFAIPVFLVVAYKTLFKKQIKKNKEENET